MGGWEKACLGIFVTDVCTGFNRGGVTVEHCEGGKARSVAVRRPTARDAEQEGETNWVVFATDGCIDSPFGWFPLYFVDPTKIGSCVAGAILF